MAITSIEWTDATWNPVRGCTKVSPGCANCYAETFAERFRGVKGHPYEQGFDLRLVPEKLTEPLSWKKPRRVFVNSMSDLFQDGVSDGYIDRVFAVMANHHRHTFQVLTKRADRMRAYCAALTAARLAAVIEEGEGASEPWARGVSFPASEITLPLPNVWLGVSVENQHFADERIPLLLQTPAAVRFISAEPLLGPVHLDAFEKGTCWRCCGSGEVSGDYFADDGMAQCECADGWDDDNPGLDWVIVGGESGAGARPFDLDWAYQIIEQCRSAGVACFIKQIGDNPRPIKKSRYAKGGDPADWPPGLRVREFPTTNEVTHGTR